MGTPPLLLRNAACWDDAARTFRPGLDIRCRDGRIVETATGLSPVPGEAVIDASGRFVIPGLIDCHVHLVSNGAATELNIVKDDPVALQAWKAADNARRTLFAGFTTVRDLGAPGQLNVHLARAIERGLIEGPRILAAGMGVTMTGGHGHGFIATEADGPDEVRKAVRTQLRGGATAVKLFASGGVLTPGVNPRSASYTEAELTAGVEEAHKAFRPVAAHAQATDGIRNAVRAGVDSIEHGVWLDESTVDLMIERRTYLVPTLTAPAVMVERGPGEGVADYAIEKSRLVMEDHIASFQRAIAAGIRVAMGTDQGTPLNRPGENAQEILRLAASGLSNAAALLAATTWAADLLRVEAGRLRPGLAADILVLEADPLTDLGVLARHDDIHAVIAAGRVVRHEASLPMEATS